MSTVVADLVRDFASKNLETQEFLCRLASSCDSDELRKSILDAMADMFREKIIKESEEVKELEEMLMGNDTINVLNNDPTKEVVTATCGELVSSDFCEETRIQNQFTTLNEDIENCMKQRRKKYRSKDMASFLGKETKLRNTVLAFYKKYGSESVSRKELTRIMSEDENLMQVASINKLFHPPKGQEHNMFIREGQDVRLNDPWIKALEKFEKGETSG